MEKPSLKSEHSGTIVSVDVHNMHAQKATPCGLTSRRSKLFVSKLVNFILTMYNYQTQMGNAASYARSAWQARAVSSDPHEDTRTFIVIL